MRIGYACINMTLKRKMRSVRLSTLRAHDPSYLQGLVDENLETLAKILEWNRAHQILFFRISSDLVPLGSHENVDVTPLIFPHVEEIAILARGMRLSMHPGQYTLPSSTGQVWENSYRDLCYHAFVLDRLGLPTSDIVLHGGGVYGDRATTAARICENITQLPETVRSRLRLENDERCWSVADLLPICEATGIPLIIDNLHHQLNGGGPLDGLPWARILATWKGQLPKLHYAEQDPAKRPGAHSAYLDAHRFLAYRRQVLLEDFDVMLECKAKEQALLRLREDIAVIDSVLSVQ